MDALLDALRAQVDARPEWIGPSMVCAIANISMPTLERLKASGRLPQHTAVTRKLHRWLRSDIELWLTMGCPDRAEFEARKAQQAKAAKK